MIYKFLKVGVYKQMFCWSVLTTRQLEVEMPFLLQMQT